MGERVAVLIVTSWFSTVRIGAAVDHVVPALEPNESGQLIAHLGIVVRIDPLDVCKHVFYMVNHQSIVVTGRRRPLFTNLANVFALLTEVLELTFVEFVRAGAWRTKIRVE